MTRPSPDQHVAGPAELPGAPPQWALARSDDGLVVWEEVAGWLRVVVMGPAVGQPPLSESFRGEARRVVREQLHAALPGGDALEECRRMLVGTDAGLRKAVGAEDGRATMLIAVVHGGEVWLGHTGDGAAALLRDDELQWLLSSLPSTPRTRAQRKRSEVRRLVVPSIPPPEEVPWIGRRVQGDVGPVCAVVRREVVRLQPGDRLVLSSVAAAELQRVGAFVTLLQAAHVDDAAQGLGSALAVHGEAPDLSIAVLEWAPERAPGADVELSEEALTDELVGDLADLIREITDEYDVGATPMFDDRRDDHLDAARAVDEAEQAALLVDAAPSPDPAPIARPAADPVDLPSTLVGAESPDDGLSLEDGVPPPGREAPSRPTLEPRRVHPAPASAPPQARSLSPTALVLGAALGAGLVVSALWWAFF